jgi:ketosteroid isomerase-like protein
MSLPTWERNPVTAAVRSAREVVEVYNLIAWNNRDLALAGELFADTVIRHDVGEVRTLSRGEAVKRIADTWELFTALRFELNLVVAGRDAEHVAVRYQVAMTLKDGTDTTVGSIEIIHVVDGRIVEVYNCGHTQGVWK